MYIITDYYILSSQQYNSGKLVAILKQCILSENSLTVKQLQGQSEAVSVVWL